MQTRVFKRKGQAKATSITLSLSLATPAEARRVARAIDRIKAAAALNGWTLSKWIGQALIEEAETNT